MNIPVPEKPTLADENSVEGLEAFTGWWFELVSHGIATNNFAPMWQVTDDQCGTCASIESATAEVYSDGGWQVGGETALTSFGSKFETNTSGSIISYVDHSQSALTVYDQNGTARSQLPAQTSPQPTGTAAVWIDGAWLMLDFGTIEPE